MELEATQEYKDALEVLKKTEQDVIPQVENPEDRQELEDLCRQVRRRWARATARRWRRPAATLNDRLLNYAYLL